LWKESAALESEVADVEKNEHEDELIECENNIGRGGM